MCNIYFTIDVEEWWSVHSFSKYIKKHNNVDLNDRIDVGINNIIDFLKQNNFSATFFLLGRVVEKHPRSIENIVKNGYDIGTHGFYHKLIYRQTREEFEEDLQKSIEVINKYTGIRVNKYRAPSYSIKTESLWAMNILKKNGIDFDSSIVPVENNRFGIKNAPKYPYKLFLDVENNFITEIPPNITKILFFNIPVSNGFFFRAIPYKIIVKSFREYWRKNISPMIVLHNWEFDNEQPLLKVPLKSRMIHYYNLSNVERKMEKLSKINNLKLVDLNYFSDKITDIKKVNDL